jgi:hypothetical protein
MSQALEKTLQGQAQWNCGTLERYPCDKSMSLGSKAVVVTAVTPAPPAFSVLLPMSYFNNFQYLSAMPQLLHVSANF